ncbi:PREDICTED: galactose-3-O-sulfotransferase 2-like [Nanorana parkeri]|uniref:galactose-3-O-sulfotransferase 2-like n=1 Tax=Nanorana parkeri TaxID=125878 RepID=UPI0008547AE9|nr:PREDICTED: galactose-3-O-sulfotransferase 2-like [Nanorana parkeri]
MKGNAIHLPHLNEQNIQYVKTASAVLIVTGTIFLALQIWDSNVSDRVYLRKALFNEDRRSCQPKRNIFFLKTHKTASSTIMNILFRYGEFHNLTFAFPVYNTLYSYPNLFSASFVNGFSGRGNNTFNIMCHHMRFRFAEVQKVMPNDTFYFTVLRNPISLMESSFTYLRRDGPFAKAKNLEDFLHNTSTYYDAKMKDSHFSKNFMTFDFGFDPNGLDTIKNVKLIQREVDIIFDLVLITEYFDESLILLKDALCWSFDDILSIPLNRRSNTTKKALSLETQEKVKRWNSLDWQLYVYFNNSFWKRVEEFGRKRMQREVKILQRKRLEIEKTCLQDEVAPNHLKDKSMVPFQSGIATILGYNLKSGITAANKLLCQRLVTPELQYSGLLLGNQKRNQQTK